jgi:hypothetical protein
VTGWVVYGSPTGDTAIIVTNAVTLALLLSVGRAIPAASRPVSGAPEPDLP